MKQVTVVGCGIIGLTSAIALQERGWKVRLLAKERFEDTLSQKVGAIWFPFAINPIEDANRWGSRSYQRYLQEQLPDNGVSFIPFTVVYNTSSDTSWTQKLPEGSVRDAVEKELPLGAETAYVATVPLAEPWLYLPNLFERFLANGGMFEKLEIDTLKQLSELDAYVVNCTGLGAKSICQDEELLPMRGQILRTEQFDVHSCVNSTRNNALSYVIRRSTDCIIGGTDYLNDWNMETDDHDTNLILTRFHEAGISMENPVILEKVVGLRPKRHEVRFTFDPQYPNVFHNYGHGGSGFTVAWGCALELAELIE
ncbi:amino acid oxidase [Chryseobacterium piperi]|uniref:D-amino-acid oxidase n=1 Tax=Chryseobacterium piperi TaxID=558152 RepID=A0A086BJ81_9FLAO|nr:FAD-dependent oxidoreductase [Chryseobacterium piperi]ASW74350.1 FAD-binding oxidoreductase [Chryseobacterium piperi]KFF28995.1 amino acid oxidase [Chryseobacterium piperi]